MVGKEDTYQAATPKTREEKLLWCTTLLQNLLNIQRDKFSHLFVGH